MLRRVNHFFRLCRELYLYASFNRAWWFFAMMLLLFAITAFVIVGQTLAPFVYTMF
jgi:hypothetical protein